MRFKQMLMLLFSMVAFYGWNGKTAMAGTPFNAVLHIASQEVMQQTANIQVTIIKPDEGALVDNNLQVAVSVESVYEIQNVTAQVADRTVNLVFSQYCHSIICLPAWVGTLSLTGLERGNQVLTVVVTDFLGGSAQTQRSFVYDQKPILTVSTPINATVARPELHITASCSDDDPTGCASLVLRTPPGCGVVMVTGQPMIDETISLLDYDGADLNLCFEAYDSAGQASYEFRQVYVESSARLEDVEKVNGSIQDVKPDRLLILENFGGINALKIRDRSTNQDTAVMADPGKKPQYGFLTPNGAIFMERSGDVLTALIYDWQNGTLVNLGFPNSNYSLKVAGIFAIWSNGNSLFRRDLGAGTNIQVADNAGNTDNDVAAANGDVVYWGGNYQIFRYGGGAATQLTFDAGLWNTYPATDGINVAYRKHTPCCNNQTYSIALYGASGETILAPARSAEAIPGRDYQLNNGWIAFTKLSTNGAALQVWRRSPTGVEQQISYFGSSSYIDSVGPAGEVTFVNQNRLYFSAPGANPIEIGSGLGRSFWQNGELYRAIGGSLFRVNPNIPDLWLTMAASSSSMPKLGEVIIYTITVTNTGPADATGIVITDTLSSGATFAPIILSQATKCSQANSVVTCSLDDLPNGAGASVSVGVIPISMGPITDTVYVLANGKDFNLNNGRATESLMVGAEVYLPIIFK